MPMQNTNLGGAATGNATSTQVLQGYTFSNAAGNDIAGTMVNNGSPTLQPGDSIAAGYYSGGSVASASVAVPATGSQSFTTPGSTAFTVPAEVTRLLAQIWSGGGGGTAGYAGGQGAYVSALLSVTPGQALNMIVGSGGTSGSSPTSGGFSAIYSGNTPLLQVTGGGAASSSGDGVGGTAPVENVFTFSNGANGTFDPLAAPGTSGSALYSGGGLSADTMFGAWNVTSLQFTATKGNTYLISYLGASAGTGTADASINGSSLTQLVNSDSGIVVWEWTAATNGVATVDITNIGGGWVGGYEGILVVGCTSPGTPVVSSSTTFSYSDTPTDPTVYFMATGGSPSALPSWSGVVQSLSEWPGADEWITAATASAGANVAMSWSGSSSGLQIVAVPCASVNATEIYSAGGNGAIVINW